MPSDNMGLQLSVAIVLACSAVISLAHFVVSRPGEGRIRLSETTEALEHDPFNVTTPEDVVDGEPIDEEGFWRKVRGNPLYRCSFVNENILGPCP
jgi:hypothetical protein